MSFIGTIAVRVMANTQGMTAGLSRSQAMIQQFERNASKSAGMGLGAQMAANIQKSLGALQGVNQGGLTAVSAALGSVIRLGPAAAAAITGVAVAVAAIKPIKLAAELERTTTAFEVMTGSAATANQLVGDLRRFAADTPLTARETMDAGRQLLAYGTSVDQVIPQLHALGDVATGVGSSIGDLAYLFGTLQASGRAMTKDINQFTDRGIPILESLAEVMRIPVESVRQAAEEGRVTIAEVTQAFNRMTGEGGRFYQMMDRQSRTISGLWAKLSDNVEMAFTRLGAILIQELDLKGVTESAIAFTDSLEAGFTRARPAIAFVGNLVGGVFNSLYIAGRAAFTFLSTGWHLLASVFPSLAPGVNSLASAVNGFFAMLRGSSADLATVRAAAVSVFVPILEGVLKIKAVLALASDWVRAYLVAPLTSAMDYIGAKVEWLWGILGAVAGPRLAAAALVWGFLALKAAIVGIGGILVSVFGGLVAILSPASLLVMTIATALVAAFATSDVSSWGEAFSSACTVAATALTWVWDKLQAGWTWLQAIGEAAWQHLAEPVTRAAQAIWSTLSQLGNDVLSHFETLLGSVDWSALGDTLIGVCQDIATWLASIDFSPLLDAGRMVADGVGWIVEQLRHLGGPALLIGGIVVAFMALIAVLSPIIGALAAVFGWLGPIGVAVVALGAGILSAMDMSAEGIASSFWSMLGSLQAAWQEVQPLLWQYIVEPISEIFANVWALIQEIGSDIAALFQEGELLETFKAIGAVAAFVFAAMIEGFRQMSRWLTTIYRALRTLITTLPQLGALLKAVFTFNWGEVANLGRRYAEEFAAGMQGRLNATVTMGEQAQQAQGGIWHAPAANLVERQLDPAEMIGRLRAYLNEAVTEQQRTTWFENIERAQALGLPMPELPQPERPNARPVAAPGLGSFDTLRTSLMRNTEALHRAAQVYEQQANGAQRYVEQQRQAEERRQMAIRQSMPTGVRDEANAVRNLLDNPLTTFREQMGNLSALEYWNAEGNPWAMFRNAQANEDPRFQNALAARAGEILRDLERAAGTGGAPKLPDAVVQGSRAAVQAEIRHTTQAQSSDPQVRIQQALAAIAENIRQGNITNQRIYDALRDSTQQAARPARLPQ